MRCSGTGHCGLRAKGINNVTAESSRSRALKEEKITAWSNRERETWAMIPADSASRAIASYDEDNAQERPVPDHKNPA